MTYLSVPVALHQLYHRLQGITPKIFSLGICTNVALETSVNPSKHPVISPLVSTNWCRICTILSMVKYERTPTAAYIIIRKHNCTEMQLFIHRSYSPDTTVTYHRETNATYTEMQCRPIAYGKLRSQFALHCFTSQLPITANRSSARQGLLLVNMAGCQSMTSLAGAPESSAPPTALFSSCSSRPFQWAADQNKRMSDIKAWTTTHFSLTGLQARTRNCAPRSNGFRSMNNLHFAMPNFFLYFPNPNVFSRRMRVVLDWHYEFASTVIKFVPASRVVVFF